MSRLQDFIKKAVKAHGDKYDYSKVEYVNSHTKIRIGCKQHNIWFEQSPTNHLTGRLGCKLCQIEVRKRNFIEKAKNIYGDKYNYSKVDYINNQTNVEIYCKKHDIWFKQLPLTHLSRSVGCKECQLEKVGDVFIDRAKKLYGNKYDYSKVKYVNNRTKVKIYSNEYNMWFSETPRSHLEQNINGMSFVETKLKMFLEKAHQLYGDKYDYSKIEYVNNSYKVKIYCNQHKVWFEQTIRGHLAGKTGCVECSKDNRKFTNIKKYGVEHLLQNQKLKEKRYNTVRKNKTFNTSKSEDEMHEKLIIKFGEDDILRQYKSREYPFLCDFYIKSLNLYIELNASWTHGGHWFDENSKEDIKQFNLWKNKNSNYYDNAIRVWTKRDVLKRNIAKENKLNYLVFWDNDLKDFDEWLNLGCLLGKDYI